MKIEFACPFCSKPHSVEPELAGRRGRCKDCGTVMRIPGERVASTAQKSTPREAPAARVAAPAEAKSMTRAGPRPAPVREPEPIVEVDDPYGLADEVPAPSSRQGLVEAGVADPEYAPLPRAGFEPSAKPKRKRRDEGPWGLQIRQAAMGLMIVVAFLGRVSRGLQRGGQWDAVSFVGTGALGLCVIGGVLVVIGLVGAAMSFARGNRLAFSGESTREQLDWFVTIGLLALNLYVGFGLPGTSHIVLTAWDARLSSAEKADITVYDRMLTSTVSFHNRFADALGTLPPPTSPGGSEAWTALGVMALEGERLKVETHSAPVPTRAQVEQLFSRHHEPLLAAFARTTRASHDVVARLNLPPDSEFGRMLSETETHCAESEQIYTKHFPAGATDSAGWYFVVYGADLVPGR